MNIGMPHLLRRGVWRCQEWLAGRYRLLLGRNHGLHWIGVTGSCGKTSTTELIGRILSGHGSGRTGHKTTNGLLNVAKTVLTVLPWHRFCVHELGAPGPGSLASVVELFKPQIGVVTHVGLDHYKQFRGRAGVAAEKGRLVECLPEGGTAILNADDPYVLALRDRTRGRVLTYGLSEEAMVRGSQVTSEWPERLSLCVRYRGEQIRVHTQLVGEHWASAVLAAVATAVVRGVSLRRAAGAIESTLPVDGRMSTVETPDGVTFIRDDWKAPLWTIPAALRILETARASRKIAIIGTISDYPGTSFSKYRDTAGQALAVADTAIFVGPNAHHVRKARSCLAGERLLAFDRLYELDQFLQEYLRTGDLVLVKGSGPADHLERVVLSRTGDIACWRERCGRWMFCSACKLRHDAFVPPGTPDSVGH